MELEEDGVGLSRVDANDEQQQLAVVH